MSQQVFPRDRAKSKRYSQIQSKLLPTSTKVNVFNNKGGVRRDERHHRRPKRTTEHKTFEQMEVIDLDKNIDFYSYVSWDGDIEQPIAPTHNGKLINVDDYVELKATKDKLNVVATDKVGSFIVAKMSRDNARSDLRGKEGFNVIRDATDLIDQNKPDIKRGEARGGYHSTYKMEGYRKDPLKSGVLGRYAFKPGTKDSVKQQSYDGAVTIVNKLEKCGKRVTKFLNETKHFRDKVQKFLKLPTVGTTDDSIATQLAIGCNYWSQWHRDPDYYFTFLSCMCKEEKYNEELIYYFVFPEYKLKVPMRSGDVLVFNPTKIHSCTNCKLPDSHIFSAYVSQKTVMTAAVGMELDKSR